MEEQKIISVEVFNHFHQLRREDFLNFNDIVSKSDFQQIKVAFYFLNESKVRVLNIMIYYIISIQKNLTIFKNDQFGQNYRGLCAKEISEYYIKNRFIIQEYEFSYFSSIALSSKIQECAHIIYYLIYGRFASHPYIKNLCSKNTQRSKKKTIKKDYSLSNVRKITINHQNTDKDYQIQNFRKDLKTALSPTNQQNIKKIQKKSDHNFSKSDQNLTRESQQKTKVSVTQRTTLNRGNSLNSFVPHRINQSENSLILENLTSQKKHYQTQNDWYRKGLMRKQKFNQFFDVNQLKSKIKLKKTHYLQQENKENSYKNINQHKIDEQQNVKINYQNFKRISTGLKNKSSTLDKIRTQCTSRNHKFNFDKQANETLQETLQKLAEFQNQKSKQFRLMNKIGKNNLGLRYSKNLQNQNFVQNINNNNGEGMMIQEKIHHRKQSMSSEKYSQYLMPFEEDENQRQGDFAVNILRNDHSHSLKNQEDDKGTQFFAQNKLGFRKIDSKNNLQKYKADYRRFLKTQTLDRIKQVS